MVERAREEQTENISNQRKDDYTHELFGDMATSRHPTDWIYQPFRSNSDELDVNSSTKKMNIMEQWTAYSSDRNQQTDGQP